MPIIPPRRAFADESFCVGTVDGSGGCYVLAAVVLDSAVHEDVRAAMRRLRTGQRAPEIAKLHWSKMNRSQRREAARAVSALDAMHVVAVGTPLPPRRQERARARCLGTLVRELHHLAVEELVMEARTRALDRRDVETVRGARYGLPPGSRFHVAHRRGADEPLCWAADIVSGAVRASHEGDSGGRAELEGCVYEIDVPTDC